MSCWKMLPNGSFCRLPGGHEGECLSRKPHLYFVSGTWLTDRNGSSYELYLAALYWATRRWLEGKR